MRVLHTADWHLGDRLGRIDRTGDLRRAVEFIAELCRREQVEMLIVAGDVFSEMARPDGLRDAVEHLRDTFASFLLGGGTILAVTGNHDNETFCQTLRHAMTLAAPTVGELGAIIASGRLYLAAEPALVRLADRVTGDLVQFVLMPFPTPSVFLRDAGARRYGSFAEKNDHLRSAFLARLLALLGDSRCDRSLPTVLVAHVGVSGSDLSNRFRISEETDVVIDEPSWPGTFAYVALGHIHKAQAIGGHAHVRYSGSIERLDLGESRDEKSVVLLEIDRNGLCGAPRTMPLEATPIYRVEVADPSEIPSLPSRFPDHERALVSLHFSYEAGRDDLLDYQRRLEAMLPRWYARDWHNRAELGPTLTIGKAATKSFETTIREYLDGELLNLSDDERQSVIDLANHYLQSADTV